MSTAVSIRLSDDIAHELGRLVRTTGCFCTHIIYTAIESYLQEYADYSVAIERLNDKDGEIISSDEMRNCIALHCKIEYKSSVVRDLKNLIRR